MREIGDCVIGRKAEYQVDIWAEDLYLNPKDVNHGKFVYECGQVTGVETLGAVFQMVAPVLIFARSGSSLEVVGGCDAHGGASALHIKAFIEHVLAKMKVKIQFSVQEEGFYPDVSGRATFGFKP